jgi:hypothetical protein
MNEEPQPQSRCHREPDDLDHLAYIWRNADPIWMSDNFGDKCRYALSHAGVEATRLILNSDASMVTFWGRAPFATAEEGMGILQHWFAYVGFDCAPDNFMLAQEAEGIWMGAFAPPGRQDPDDIDPQWYIDNVPAQQV